MSADSLSSSEITKQERKTDAIFSRFDTPFYLDQHNFNIVWLGTAHLFFFYSIYLSVFGLIPRSTFFFEFAYGVISGFGITVGCHRYWSHKTFKANLPLQILLMVLQTASNQYPIRKWCLDHRIHHKYTDTNSDPHNSTRGFWFSHVGWLFLPKHPDLKEKLKTFEIPDLDNDPVVRFQSRWYWTLQYIFQFILPISFICYMWDLSIIEGMAVNYRRYVGSLHFTWTVNSIAHIWGDKPFDKSISAAQNRVVSFLAIGEGWHNYHHTFPWDYKASEFGWKLNLSSVFIDFFAWLGWAYDLKTVSQKMLKDRLLRTGDKSYAKSKHISGDNETTDDFDYKSPVEVTDLMKDMDYPIWGWDDEKLPDDFRNITKILRPEGKK